MEKFKLDIAFFTDGLAFDGDTIKQKGLGGSESALYYMAKEIAAQNHNVVVFSKMTDQEKEGKYDNVLYLNNQRYHEQMQNRQWDVVILSRFFEGLPAILNSKLNVMWNHDIMTDAISQKYYNSLFNADMIINLSEYHKEQYVKHFFDNLKNYITISRNGYDQNLIPKEIKKNKNKLIFTSRPERGLMEALGIYEKLLIDNPNLELDICAYNTVDDPRVKQYVRVSNKMIEDLIKYKNAKINILGSLRKKDLYKKIAESYLVLYPTSFPEISCISAIESQALGTPIITSNAYALKETVADENNLIDLNDDKINIDKYIDRIKQLNDGDAYNESVEIGKKDIKNYQWQKIASEWLENFYKKFENRSCDKTGILERLIKNSDLVAAKEFCKNNELDEKGKVLSKKVYGWLEVIENKTKNKDAYEDESNFSFPEGNIDTPNNRFDWAIENLKDCNSVLDYACHTGILGFRLLKLNKDIEYTGYDLSANAIKHANKYLEKQTKEVKENMTFTADFEEIKDKKYDAIVLGEILEHIIDPCEFMQKMQGLVKEGGKIIVTLPKGAWESSSFNKYKARYHVHGFEDYQVMKMFEDQKNKNISTFITGSVENGEPVGYYYICYENTNTFISFDEYKDTFEKKFYLTRPYQSVSVCMITKNEENMVGRTLKSIDNIADELIIYDTGSTDYTSEFAKKYGCEIIEQPKEIFRLANSTNEFDKITDMDTAIDLFFKAEGTDKKDLSGIDEKSKNKIENLLQSIIDNDKKADLDNEETKEAFIKKCKNVLYNNGRIFIEGNWEDDFGQARNNGVCLANGKWILWIDADEQLINYKSIPRYLNSEIFKGYIIRQNQLQIDMNSKPDLPIRLFKCDIGAKCYGVVHEHFEIGQDKKINPMTIIQDVDIAHNGYTNEAVRREKCLKRNMKKLIKDRIKNPNRRLGKILEIRDYINALQWNIEKNVRERGYFGLDQDGMRKAQHIINTYNNEFKDKEDEFFPIMFEQYQKALQSMKRGYETKFHFQIGLNGLKNNQNINTESVWFESPEAFRDFSKKEIDKIYNGLIAKKY